MTQAAREPTPAADAPRTAVILLAAGEGRRVGAGTNKVLLPLLGEPVFTWSLRRVLAVPGVTEVVLVIRPEDRAEIDRGLALLADAHPGARIWIVHGGSTRHGSEWSALRAVARAVDADEVDVVAIHDAARPLADEALFAAVVRSAHEHGGALPVRAQRSLVSRGPGRPLDGELVAVQTPQAFRAKPLLDAYRQADRDGFTGTDTASCVERYTDLEIHCVDSPATNIKITFPEDVSLAERLLSKG
ncbi:MAG TPA: IspD/TarI family cytidylyltransferase [Nocardioidaceae bacterium]|nr:IspD/TarI family cytidylyltransferase [Nocardioidaceae bacterium]